MSDTVHLIERAPASGLTRVSAFAELAKPRVSALVLFATAVGFLLALPPNVGSTAVIALVNTILGTALVAIGANALNHYLEVDTDRRMQRTSGRPLPSGRLTPLEVLTFGTTTGMLGVLYLVWRVNLLTAFLAALTLGLYVFAYTPLKRRTTFCVFVGAVPGALPPVIGWAGATGSLAVPALVLFAVVFFWQLPHFAAIAWLYRADYAAAGLVMMPVVDREGTRTNLHVVTHSVGLLAVSLLPAMCGMAGPVYAAGAAALGLVYLAMGVALIVAKTDRNARRALLFSVIYLPLLFTLMMLDKTGHA